MKECSVPSLERELENLPCQSAEGERPIGGAKKTPRKGGRMRRSNARLHSVGRLSGCGEIWLGEEKSPKHGNVKVREKYLRSEFIGEIRESKARPSSGDGGDRL